MLGNSRLNAHSDPASSKILLVTVIELSCGYLTLDMFLYIICLLEGTDYGLYLFKHLVPRRVLGKYLILNYKYMHTYVQLYLSPTNQKANKDALFFFHVRVTMFPGWLFTKWSGACGVQAISGGSGNVSSPVFSLPVLFVSVAVCPCEKWAYFLRSL